MSVVGRTEYYRAEAERVQRLAEESAPGRGREQFERVAYRTSQPYYRDARYRSYDRGYYGRTSDQYGYRYNDGYGYRR